MIFLLIYNLTQEEFEINIFQFRYILFFIKTLWEKYLHNILPVLFKCEGLI